MMLWIISAVVIYLFLKICHVSLGSREGFEPREFDIREAFGAGEPMVAIMAALISVIAALYSQWSTTRLAAREIGHSTICYGRLAASNYFPDLDKKYRLDAVEDFQQSYRSVAERHAPWIKMSAETIDVLLDGAKRHYEAYYAGIVTQGDGKSIAREFDAIERCFADDWDAHGELLNP